MLYCCDLLYSCCGLSTLMKRKILSLILITCRGKKEIATLINKSTRSMPDLQSCETHNKSYLKVEINLDLVLTGTREEIGLSENRYQKSRFQHNILNTLIHPGRIRGKQPNKIKLRSYHLLLNDRI